ncbi:cbb3-type cytochrome oxidase subunit 3 [Catenovulum sp. SM1970]|uniref:cbb3-type cytochrome oxidase subunit 3 n=1 Tax=Marinifaba aquimaris TaxID=2741323 RepID=UPI0015726088|nr:cbb3-type cytochrome c oxidase subunit 3 [Marinifaba aquimaris]NTS77308.1 cbb3-type cytochrome oxidase subunit 3 [Marinifaba aquimaris]
MDYGTFRGIYTIVMIVVFVGIIWWAYSRQSKSKFDDAANSIFEEDKKADTEQKIEKD